MPRPYLLVLSFALLACGPSGPGPAPDGARHGTADSAAPPAAADSVELRVDRSEYRSGDTVKMTLVNRTGASYAFNPCTRGVELETQSGWLAVAEPDRVCTMIAWLLEPNASRDAVTALPSGLRHGRYRLTVSLTREDKTPPTTRVTAASQPFTVAP